MRTFAPVVELHAPAHVADGLPCVPPSGPAIPVMPTPTWASKRSIAPSASASATSGETAPCVSINAGSMPSSLSFASFE